MVYNGPSGLSNFLYLISVLLISEIFARISSPVFVVMISCEKESVALKTMASKISVVCFIVFLISGLQERRFVLVICKEKSTAQKVTACCVLMMFSTKRKGSC